MNAFCRLCLCVILSLAAFFGTSEAKNITFTADYVLRNPNVFPNASLRGTVIYHYNTDKEYGSRVRFENTLTIGGKQSVVAELYHYYNKAVYSICTSECTAQKLSASPDKWWHQSTDTFDGNDGAYKRYLRSTSNGHLVTELTVKGDGDPTSDGFDISSIKFKDGRVLSFVPGSFKTVTFKSQASKFEPQASLKCPEPVCKNYVDIVFVIDASNSVDNTDWSQTKQFILGVIDQFELGPGAAYVSVIQFNSPHATCGPNPDGKGKTEWKEYCCGNVTQKPVDNGKRRPVRDCYFDTMCDPKNDHTAHVDIHLGYQGITPRVKNIKKTPGHTCQRYGLELAYKELFQNNPRAEGNNRPVPIVIAVTDGEEDCPNSTVVAADRLVRNGVILIEVGVGLMCQYDKNYLANISTKIDGFDTILLVNNYDEVSGGIQKLILPVCETTALNGGCSLKCNGACACGTCVCPDCDAMKSPCDSNTCTVRQGMTDGCVYEHDDCQRENNKCLRQWCDDNAASKDSMCHREVITCEKELNLADCQKLDCVKDTGCVRKNIINLTSRCPTDKCHTSKCDPDNSPDKTGCVYTDVDCSDPRPCMRTSCDPNTGCTSVDTCEEFTRGNMCYSAVCTINGCVYTKKEPVKSSCIAETSECVNTTGYKYKYKTEEWCRANDPDASSCKSYKCTEGKGCESSVIPNCNACSKDQGLDDAKCQLGTMEKEEIPGACWSSRCVTVDGMPQCHNESIVCQKRDCQTVSCVVDPTTGKGECVYEDIVNPYKDLENKCYSSVCHGTYYTLEFTSSCVSDDLCINATCDNNTGTCTRQPTCPHQACKTETCDKDTGACTYTDVVCEPSKNKCLVNICDVTVDACIPVENVHHGCNDEDECTKDICNTETGECEFVPVENPLGNDPCMVYSCNPKTGNWTEEFKCNDGKRCTQDICTPQGECMHPPVVCDINMDNYPCFYPDCNEKRFCYRKLLTHVYIDICGNCVSDGTESSSFSYTKEDADAECLDGQGAAILPTAITAGAVAGIVLAVIIVFAALTVSGVFGTKELIRRANTAGTDSAHSNPLYESDENEMQNPAYAGAAE